MITNSKRGWVGAFAARFLLFFAACSSVLGDVTVADLGLDHFLLDRHIDVTTVALTTAVIDWIERRGGNHGQMQTGVAP
jgi:hypothetical protein